MWGIKSAYLVTADDSTASKGVASSAHAGESKGHSISEHKNLKGRTPSWNKQKNTSVGTQPSQLNKGELVKLCVLKH